MSPTAEKMAPPRLKVKYATEIRKHLQEKFSLTNVHQIPRLRKIVVNMGVGEGAENKKRVDAAMEDLAALSGQKPKLCRAKVSVAGFKLREGMPIGCKVTLRGDRMFEFLDRLLTVAMPRIRDFRGVKQNSFDGRGNFAMGLTEQVLFPEINLDRVEWTQGMDVCMVITGGSDEMSLELLTQLGMPFRRN